MYTNSLDDLFSCWYWHDEIDNLCKVEAKHQVNFVVHCLLLNEAIWFLDKFCSADMYFLLFECIELSLCVISPEVPQCLAEINFCGSWWYNKIVESDNDWHDAMSRVVQSVVSGWDFMFSESDLYFLVFVFHSVSVGDGVVDDCFTLDLVSQFTYHCIYYFHDRGSNIHKN
jgi:hypothetical protein